MATATKTILRKSGTKIEISLTRDEIDNISFADGDNINLGRKIAERTSITLTMPNGQREYGSQPTVLDTRRVSNKALIAQGAYASIGNACFQKDAYDEIMAALAELDAQIGKSDEYMILKQAEEDSKARGEANERRLAAEQTERESRPGYCRRCHDYTYGDCGHN
jgi:hypothetical protein